MLPGAHALMRLLGLADGATPPAAPRARLRMLVEEIEPRILHSADPLAAALGDVNGAAVEMRVVEVKPSTSEQPVATQQTQRHELVIVDPATADYQILVDDIVAQSTAERTFDIVLLDGTRDGVAQITDALGAMREVDAVHIISHGNAGEITLGSTVLNVHTLEARGREIAGWGRALAADADVLVYGCDVAASADGRFIVDKLARLTGADVAASDDGTGGASLGADWNLEYAAGSIESSVAVSAAAQSSWENRLATDLVLVSYEPTFAQLSDIGYESNSGQSFGQGFIYDSPGATYAVDKVAVVLHKTVAAAAGQTITVSIRSGAWNGALIASGTISSDALSLSEAWETVTLTSTATLSDNVTYFVRIDSNGTGNVYLGVRDDLDGYAGGQLYPGAAGKDMAFRIIDTVVNTAAPLLTGANSLTAISEDTATNTGTLVSSLIAGHVTDADAGSPSGIAVTAVDNANGTWQYTTNGGSTWASFGAPSAASARLLGADANTSVRFAPNANFNGSVATGLTFRAWDQSSGTAGGTADTSVNGAVTAFSTATASSSITVSSVNDAPVGTSNTVTAVEDSALTFTAAHFGFTDPADTAANALSNVKITTLPAAGALTLSGVAVTAGQFVSLANINAGNLVFTPVANANGAGYASFTFQVQDDGGTASGGVDLDTSARTMTVNVTAVQDAPVLAGANNLTTINEDAATNTGTLVSALISGQASDADAAALSGIAVTGVTNTNGTWQYSTNSGGSWSNFGSPSAGSARLLAADANSYVRFVPNANWNGTVTGGLAFRAWDQTMGTNGGLAWTIPNPVFLDNFSATAYGNNNGTANWTANWVDTDADPTLGKIKVTAGELEFKKTTGAESIYREADLTGGTSATLSFSYRNLVGPADPGSYVVEVSGNGGASYTTVGTFSGVSNTGSGSFSADISAFISAATRVRFQSPVNAPQDFFVDNVQIALTAPGTGGSSAFSSAAAASSITVSSVNDAPVGTSTAVTTNEDTPHVFTTAGFGFSDASDSPANSLQAVKIVTLPAAGALRLGGVAVTAGQFVSAADIGAGNLVFTPAANANGAGYASFTFQLQDSGGTALGGVDLDTVARSMTINVTAVADAPVGTTATVATNEDTPYTFSTASFGFSDVDLHNFTAVKITTQPVAGSLTLSGAPVSGGQFITVADLTAGNLVFTPAANANGAAYASFTFQVQDSGTGANLDTIARTMTIDVTAVNDAPANTLPAAQSIVTDTPLVLSSGGGNAISVSDVDAAGASLQVTLAATNGVLTLAATTGLTFSVGTGTGNASMTFTGTVAAINVALDGLRFDPTAAFSGAAQIDITTNDLGNTGSGGARSTTNALPVNVSFVNAAPALSGANSFGAINEDAFTNAGTSVSDLIAGMVSDANAGALPGIAVTAVLNTNGAWQYSLNSGGSWSAFGAPGAANARLLAGDANTYIRFVPNANLNGTVTNDVTFRAWDQTSGTAGGTADVSVNGGSTAFSTATASSSITVTSVNDAPVGTSNTVITNEDTALAFTAAHFGFTDPLDSPANALAAVKITTLASAGSLTLSGTAVTAGQTIAVADINAGNLVFTPAANVNGTGYASFTFQVQDNGGGADLDTTARTMTVNVTAVNDAPVGTSNTVTTNEDTACVFTAATFGFTDPSDAPANTLAAVRMTTLPAAGALTLSGVAVVAGQTVSVADINAGNLVFTPVANANGAGYASFTFQVQDNGGTASGGADLDTTARTLTVNVTAVNDAPVGTSNTVTTNEDTALVFTAAHFGFTDPSDSPANSLSAVKITTLASAGSLTLSGTAVGAGQTIAVADINAGNLVFTPVANANGAGYASLTFQVQDNGGGADLDTTARTLTVNVTAVNDAPVGTSNTVTTNEDTALAFTAAHFGFTDPSDSPANSLSAVKITTLASAGSLTLSGTAVTAGQTIAVADINAGNLVFTPVANANGAGYASFTFQVQDNGGGADLDTTARALTVNVTAVNDAPVLVGANNLTTINEDAATNPGTLVSALIAGQVSDPESAALSGIAVTAVTNTNGTWQYSIDSGGSWLDFGAPSAGTARLLAADASTYVRFMPNANWNGTVAGGLTFRAWDQTLGMNGGVAPTIPNPVLQDNFSTVSWSNNDGTASWSTNWVDSDGDPDAGKIKVRDDKLEIRAVGSSSVYREADLTGATSATLSFSYDNDLNAGASILAQISNDGGASYTTIRTFSNAVNPGSGTFSTDISAFISSVTRLRFQVVTASGGELEVDNVRIAFTAPGNGGSAAFSLATAASSITVSSVNDAPAGANRTVTAREDTAFVFTAAHFGFSDTSDSPADRLLAVKIATLPAAGALTLDGVAVSAGQSVSVVDIDAGKLLFNAAANAKGNGYASFTFQVQDDGGTALGGVDLSVARTITVNVSSVNDAPVGLSNTVVTSEDTPYAFNAAAFGFSDPADVPANSFKAVKITTLPGAGALTLNGTAVTAGQVVQVADINAARLLFTPTANANGVAYASFTFQVQDDGGTGNGGVNLDPTARTMTIDVTAVNDAPVGTSNTVTTNEDTAFTFTTAAFGFTDPADAPANTLAAVKITTLPVSGSLRLSGVAVIAGQTIAAADINAGNLVFTPVANANGAGYSTFTFEVQDGGGTANGGSDTDTAARTMTIDVTSVNDAPTGTSATLTIDEDAALTLSAAHFGFGDANDAAGNALASLRINTISGAGTLKLSGVAVTASQTVSAADIDAGNLVFTPALNASGASYASFTFQVRDSGGTANGGVDLDTTARSLTIDVRSVNDAPAAASNVVTTNEDTPFFFRTADFGFSDAGDSPANVLSAVRITGLPGAGTLTLGGVALTAGQSVSAARIAAGDLVFTPAVNANGAGYASFTFEVQDDGGTSNGGVDVSAITRTMTIDVSAVNDAPVGASNTVSMVPGSSHAFSAAAFGFSDRGDTPADAFVSVKVSSLPTAGSLTLHGTAVTNGQAISAADLNAGHLVFSSADAGNAAFTFQVQDSGGGADTDPTPRTLTIQVAAPPRQEIVAAPVEQVIVVQAPVVIERVASAAPTQPAASATASASAAAPAAATPSATTVAPTAAAAAEAAEQKAEAAGEAGSKSASSPAEGQLQGQISPEDSRAPATGASSTAAAGGVVQGQVQAQVQGQPQGQIGVQRADSVQAIKDARDAAIGGPADSQSLMQQAQGDISSFTSIALAMQVQSSSASELLATPESRALGQELDQLRDSLKDQTRLEAATVAATAATGMSLSVGYVVWLLRGGALLSTFLSSLPAWRFIDPLPVLGRIDDDEDDDDGDDSLESIVASEDAKHHDAESGAPGLASDIAPDTAALEAPPGAEEALLASLLPSQPGAATSPPSIERPA